jgi:hypothetical protein
MVMVEQTPKVFEIARQQIPGAFPVSLADAIPSGLASSARELQGTWFLLPALHPPAQASTVAQGFLVRPDAIKDGSAVARRAVEGQICGQGGYLFVGANALGTDRRTCRADPLSDPTLKTPNVYAVQDRSSDQGG